VLGGWAWLGVWVAICLVIWGTFLLSLLLFGRRDDARELVGFVPDCVVLFRRLLIDERMPRRGKYLIGVLAFYLAFPIDLIPDFVPVIGFLDDALLLTLAGRYILRAAGRDVLEELWPGSPRGLQLILTPVGRA
jgi:uncharacterized membrane protein YkvA (DUF1232 family)